MLRNDHQETLRCGNQLVELTSPIVMGILNVTPDSFYSPGRVGGSVQRAVEAAEKMLEEGASILDIGGMSSRPGALEISVEEEKSRVIPVVEAIHSRFPHAVISVDTYRSSVAESCIQAGATMINDISGGQMDEKLMEVVANTRVAYVLMHLRGTPADMQQHTDYHDLISDLVKYFVNKLRTLHQKGIRDIVLDPGFGFAKTMAQNYRLIDQLGVFRMLGCPVMVGVSRKSTLSGTIGRTVEDTLEATTAMHMMALHNGALILRVHDVRPAMDAIAVHYQFRMADPQFNKRLN